MRLHFDDVDIPEPAMIERVTRWVVAIAGWDMVAEIESNDDGTDFTVVLTDRLVHGRARQVFKNLGTLEEAHTKAAEELRRRWLIEKIELAYRDRVDGFVAAL